MGQVFDTLVTQHDLRFVALAGLVCALAAFSGISLLIHARRSKGAIRAAWSAVAAISVGFGIWATHFIAMLSFDSGIPAGYDIAPTLTSLAVAILVCGGGLALAANGTRRSDIALGGAIVGLGISLMHYLGMSALVIGGQIGWDWSLVAISVLTGIGFGALALYVGTLGRRPRWRWAGTALLTVAVCSMHFTAMGAAGFENCYAVVGPNEISTDLMSLAVGSASILILLLSLGGLYLDMRDRNRARAEARRMRSLADAAVEGLIVCDGPEIVTVNAAFGRLFGDPDADLSGRPLSQFIAPTVCIELFEKARRDEFIETDLRAHDGKSIPVEIVLRSVEFGGRPHQAIAVRDLRARKQAETHIRFLAHNDAMTGLANRASFNIRLSEEVGHARRLGQRFAVMCIDLDRFKEVNDLFGHAAGDALLQKVAQAITASVGEIAFAARLGGDEFALIVPDIGPEGAGQAVARVALDAFEAVNQADETGALISASIGIAVYPDHATDPETLMTYADTALYGAKEDGRGAFKVFEPEMGAAVLVRRQMEHDLRHALARGEFSLVYQPQVDLSDGEVTGFEALLRWTHPVRGPVSPAQFIPVAEESGLIQTIGEWVFRTACQEAATWSRPLSIAVNVSPLQLHASHFPDFVEQTLVQTGLDPARLEIEITESALIRNMSRALSALRRIKALGVRIAMDDFGTGYSSLSNLRAFPFDKIKVDQSFVRSVHTSEQSATIVRAVLGLGKGLRLPVLAEGVETIEELEFLKGEVCEAAQGYWLGRPKAIEAYRAITSGQHHPRETVTPLHGRRAS